MIAIKLLLSFKICLKHQGIDSSFKGKTWGFQKLRNLGFQKPLPWRDSKARRYKTNQSLGFFPPLLYKRSVFSGLKENGKECSGSGCWWQMGTVSLDGVHDSEGWVLGRMGERTTSIPRWVWGQPGRRVCALNFLGGDWKDDRTPCVVPWHSRARGSGNGDVALRQPLRAQHCM